MSDFLTRLAMRALGRARVAQPLRRSQFEAGPELVEGVLTADDHVRSIEPPPPDRSRHFSQSRLQPVAEPVAAAREKTPAQSREVEESRSVDDSDSTLSAAARTSRMRLPSPVLPPFVAGRVRTEMVKPGGAIVQRATVAGKQPRRSHHASRAPVSSDPNEPPTDAVLVVQSQETSQPSPSAVRSERQTEDHPEMQIVKSGSVRIVHNASGVGARTVTPLSNMTGKEEPARLSEVATAPSSISPLPAAATKDEGSNMKADDVLLRRTAGGQRSAFNQTTRFSEENFSMDSSAATADRPSTRNAGLPHSPVEAQFDESAIEIHIGRIEIHAPMETDVTESVRETETLTLEEYLSRRRDRMP